MRPPLSPSAAVLILALCFYSAAAAPAANALFPAEGALKPSGASLVIRVGPAVGDRLQIRPVTFLSRPGTNPGEGSKSMCGLVIAALGHPLQGVITVGTGVTEATPSCDSVLTVGTVPAAPGQQVRRLGAIYAVSSRNAADGRTAVVVRRDAHGVWIVDEDATAQVDTMTRYTIAELRRQLR